jgi:hypothetical protein
LAVTAPWSIELYEPNILGAKNKVVEILTAQHDYILI